MIGVQTKQIKPVIVPKSVIVVTYHMSSKSYWSLTLKGLFVFVCLFSLSPLFGQKVFVGTIEYNVTVKGDVAEMMRSAFPSKMVLTSDGKNTKTTLDGMMPQEILSIGKDKYLIDHDNKLAKHFVVDEVLEGKKMPTLTKTKRNLKILGYEAQEFIITSKGEDGTSSNAFAYVHKGIKLPNGNTTTSIMSLPKELDGMMLKMMVSLPITDTQTIDMELTATKVTPNNVKEDAIKLPIGYKIEEQKMSDGK